MFHHLRKALALLCGVVLTLAARAEAQQKKLEVREFKAVGDGFRKEQPKGEATKPTLISTAEELAKAIPEKEVQAQLKKDVDFAKEQLLFFAWSGSGTDRLSWKVDEGKKGPEVVFLLKPGLTDDIKAHFHLYGIPKGAVWRVMVSDK